MSPGLNELRYPWGEGPAWGTYFYNNKLLSQTWNTPGPRFNTKMTSYHCCEHCYNTLYSKWCKLENFQQLGLITYWDLYNVTAACLIRLLMSQTNIMIHIAHGKCTVQMYQTNSLECPIEGRVRIYGWGGSFINGTKAVNSHWIMVCKPTNFIWRHPEWCFRSEIGNSLFQWDSLTVWYKTKFGSQSFGYQPSVEWVT